MDLVLIAITVGAMVLAVGLSIVGLKLLRQDRADLDARVESLRALAAAPDPALVADDVFVNPVAIPFIERASASESAERSGDRGVPASDAVGGSAGAKPPGSEFDWDTRLGSRHEADVEPVPHVDAGLLIGMPVISSTHRRGLVVAAVAVVMVATAGTAYAVYRPLTSPAHAAVATAVPLDLLSLSETTDADGTFTVTGLVGNPAAARPAARVVAVVYLFDRDGHYFATGQAALDLSSLAPGNQSPFVVRVPHGAGAARYRVGFREPDGSVVAHLDKRGQSIDGTTDGAAAQKGSAQ